MVNAPKIATVITDPAHQGSRSTKALQLKVTPPGIGLFGSLSVGSLCVNSPLPFLPPGEPEGTATVTAHSSIEDRFSSSCESFRRSSFAPQFALPLPVDVCRPRGFCVKPDLLSLPGCDARTSKGCMFPDQGPPHAPPQVPRG